MWVRFLAVALLAAAFTFNASASTIQLVSGNLSANILFSPDFSAVMATDFRSDAAFLVSNPDPLGVVVTSDFGAPVGNSLIVALDLSSTEGGTLTFFPGLALFSPDKQLMSVPVVGMPITVITKPELAEFLKITGANFSLLGVTPLGNGNLAQYGLTSLQVPGGEVPEPGAASLVALGLGFCVLRMRLCR